MEMIKSINGETLADVMIRLNHVIQKLDVTSLNLILKNYEATTYVEKLIRVTLIKRTKSTEFLLEMLTGGNLFYIKHAMKCDWFFADNENLLNFQFVKYLFDNIPATSRVKLLKKYLKNLNDFTKCSLIFNYVRSIYGLELALCCLSGCNPEFIENILNELKMPLSAVNADLIYDVYPKIITNYIDKSLENSSKIYFDSCSYQKIFVKLIKRDTKKFVELYDNYDFSLERISRKNSRLILLHGYDSIVKNAKKYDKILNLKIICSTLKSGDLDKFYENLLPKDFDDFKNNMSSYYYYDSETYFKILECTNDKDILMRSLKNVYDLDYDQLIDCFSVSSVKILAENDRIYWAMKKLKNLSREDEPRKYDIIAYLKPEDAIPQLKKLLERSVKIDDRSNIVTAMFNCLKYNKDYDILHELCVYVVNRLRNDTNILDAVLASLVENEFNLKKCPNANIWIPIMELINLFVINGKLKNYNNSFNAVEILKNLILNKLHRDETDIDKYLQMILNYLRTTSYDFNIAKTTPNEKKILMWFNENIDKVKKKDEENVLKYQKKCLLQNIIEFNLKNKIDKIKINEYLIDYAIEELRENPNYCDSFFVKTIIKDEDVANVVIEKLFPNYCDYRFLFYLLKKNPKLIYDNMKDIVKFMLENYTDPSYKQLLAKFKFYISPAFSEKCLRILLDLLNSDDENDSVKENCVKFISYLMNSDDFINLIEKYHPTNDKVTDYDDEVTTLYRIQSSIGSNLKNSSTPYKMIETLQKYLIGDYLKLAVGSMLSIFLRTPEKICLEILMEWLNSRVSLRKHVFRLLCKIGPITESIDILLTALKTEKNFTLRDVMFKYILRLHQKNVHEDTWNKMKLTLQLMDAEHHECFNSFLLIDLRLYPSHLVSDYFKFTHKLFADKLTDEDLKIKYISSLLHKVDEYSVELINDDVVDTLVKNAYGNNNNELCTAYNNFFSNYMIYACDESQYKLRVEKYLNIIIPLLKKDLQTFNTGSFSYLSNFTDFINILFDLYKDRPLKLLKIFQDQLYLAISKEDILYISYLIELKICYVQYKDDDLDEIVSKLYNIFDEYYKNYGEFIFQLIKDPLINVFNTMISTKFDDKFDYKLKVANGLMKLNSNTENLFFILNFIKEFSPIQYNNKSDNKIKLYLEFLKKLKNFNNPVITQTINHWTW